MGIDLGEAEELPERAGHRGGLEAEAAPAESAEAATKESEV